MKKITWDDLIIENTRKCNMSPICAHCMRGDPQNLDISHQAIDNLISQTAMIERLQFIGGEPFCNIPAIKYILTKIKQNNIPLYDLMITTNGITDVNTISPIITDYAEYIAKCRANPIDRFRVTISSEELVTIIISRDDYHGFKELVCANIIEYRHQFDKPEHVNVVVSYKGNIPFFTGRAKKYIPANQVIYSENNIIDSCSERRIEILDNSHKPICRYYRTYKLMYPDQVIIVCPVAMSANGKLIHGFVNQTCDYDKMDNPYNIISDINISKNIYEDILSFNENRLICMDIDVTMAHIRREVADIIDKHNKAIIANSGNKKFQRTDGIIISTNIDDATEAEINALKHSADMSLDERRRIINGLKQRCYNHNYDREAVELQQQIKPGQTYADYKKAKSIERANSPRLNAIRAKLLADHKNDEKG